MQYKYASVIVDNKAVQTDKPFTYRLDDRLSSLVTKGMRVIVPFGRGNKNIKAIVVDVLREYESNYRLKYVVDVLDDRPIIDSKLLDLSRWISEYYLSSYLDALNLVLPPGDFKEINTLVSLGSKAGDYQASLEEGEILNYLRARAGEKILLPELKKDLKISSINKYLNSLEDRELIAIEIAIDTRVNKKFERWVKMSSKGNINNLEEVIGRRAKKQIEIARLLVERGPMSMEALLKALNTTDSPVKGLEAKGLVDIYSKEVKRDPVTREIKNYPKHRLNLEQSQALETIIRNAGLKNANKNFLIHGVTGSGKTEIYLQLVEKLIERGRDAIILVPEISLTPQTVERFIGRFGKDVAVLHSKLSQGERFDQWRMIREGEVKIAVGARSAVFAPFKNLGLIILDEEHEDSYKSSNNPKYDTIEVAKKRMELEDGILVLGTATPSIESYYRTQRGDYKLLSLKSRVNKEALPEVRLVDMRKELELGNRSIFSKELYDLMKLNLERGRQTILFLNKRGFTSFVSCRSCGYVVKCEACEVSMTFHRSINRLKCHYCGSTKPIPRTCPSCSSKYIKHFGIGTEQVEYITRQTFKEARVVRMDTDTMTRKNSYEETLSRMKAGEIDILIGTQMISKGLDFSGVTLVGIIAADTTLNLPDFRSPEKSFQLVTQVAGRAGRGQDTGRVVLQTYNPSHYSIQFSKEHDYLGFYDQEIRLRESFLYPPFRSLISILVYGEDNIRVSNTIGNIVKYIVDNSRKIHGLDRENFLAGPYPAPIERIRKNYRWYTVLKVENSQVYQVKSIIKKVCIENVYKLDLDDVKISIDINPRAIL